MTAKLKPATLEQVEALGRAIGYLRLAMAALSYADAPKSFDQVRRAIESAEGAYRHIQRREQN